MRIGSVLWALWSALLAGGVGVARPLPVGFLDSPVAGGWVQPVGLTFSASGRMFVWEKTGRVWIVENGVKLATPLIDLSDEVGDWRDFGLLGFALDPAYETNGRFYLSYVVDHHHLEFFGTGSYDPQANAYFRDTIARVTRYTATPASGLRVADPLSRTVLIGESATTGIPILHQSHGPGALAFGHDGTLLVSCGDGASYSRADAGGPNSGSSNTALAEGIITAGEDVGAFRAQQVDSLNGKVLRISPETGDGVSDNPFFNAAQPRSARSRVYALGLRNPFRFSVRPEIGRHAGVGTLFIGDNGWNDWEELNVATAGGRNFGWPLFEGTDPQGLYVATGAANPFAPNPLAGGSCAALLPFVSLCVQDVAGAASFPNPCNVAVQIPGTTPVFEHARAAVEWGHDAGPARVPTFSGNAAATSVLGTPGCPVIGSSFGGNSSIAGSWYPANGPYPAAYRGTFFQADFVSGWIKALVFDTSDRLLAVREFASNGSFPGLVCMSVNPADGLLYFVQLDFFGGTSIRKVEYFSNLPPTASASIAGLNYGASPFVVSFSSAESSDPEGGALVYEWDFGDGSAVSNAPNPVHTFTASSAGPARFDVTLTVRDSGGLEATRALIVSVNNTPPMVGITSPVDGSLFPPGADTVVPMTSLVSDLEHGPGELACSWLVLLHHDTHVHPEPPVNDCDSSAVVSGAHGANSEVFYFEFLLTVTDAHGLSATRSASMFPDLPACQGDVTRDGRTDTADLVVLLGDFGSTGVFGLDGDLNYDSSVNTGDLVMLLGGFGCVAPARP